VQRKGSGRGVHAASCENRVSKPGVKRNQWMQEYFAIDVLARHAFLAGLGLLGLTLQRSPHLIASVIFPVGAFAVLALRRTGLCAARFGRPI